MSDDFDLKEFSERFLCDMIMLDSEERGIYVTLAHLILKHDGTLDDNDKALSKHCNCGRAAYRRAKASFLKYEKLKLRGGKLYLTGKIAEYMDPDSTLFFPPERTKRTPIGKTLRAFIMERDGYQCVYCNDADGPFHIDHIHPLSRGGMNDPENLCCACAACNCSKGNKLVSEWERTDG